MNKQCHIVDLCMTVGGKRSEYGIGNQGGKMNSHVFTLNADEIIPFQGKLIRTKMIVVNVALKL